MRVNPTVATVAVSRRASDTCPAHAARQRSARCRLACWIHRSPAFSPTTPPAPALGQSGVLLAPSQAWSGSLPRNPIRRQLHLLLGSAVGGPSSVPSLPGCSPPALTRRSLLPPRTTVPGPAGAVPAQKPILTDLAPPPFAARRAAQVGLSVYVHQLGKRSWYPVSASPSVSP